MVTTENKRCISPRRAASPDPRTKVCMVLVMSVVVFVCGFDLYGCVLRSVVALITATLLLSSGKRKAAVFFAVAFALAISTQLAGEGLLFSVVDGTSVIGVILRFAIFLILGFMPATLCAYYMITSTRVGEFVAAMQRVRLPQTIVIPLSVMFRFFPTVAEEYRSIQDAMKMRGVKWSRGPLAMMEYRMVPLIVSVVKIGDELSAASVARGLGGEQKRVSACEIGFGWRDSVLFLLMAVLIVMSFIGPMVVGG